MSHLITLNFRRKKIFFQLALSKKLIIVSVNSRSSCYSYLRLISVVTCFSCNSFQPQLESVAARFSHNSSQSQLVSVTPQFSRNSSQSQLVSAATQVSCSSFQPQFESVATRFSHVWEIDISVGISDFDMYNYVFWNL